MGIIIPNEGTRNFIRQHLHDDVYSLALRKTPPDVNLPFALQQIAARQLLSKKVPSWSSHDELLFPLHLSIEQSSSEATAVYKSNLLSGKHFVDLTGGLGVDCYFIAPHFEKAVYIEQDGSLCDIARHNFEQLHSSVEVIHQKAEDFLTECRLSDFFLIDPARRDKNGRKIFRIEDCTPNVALLQEKLLEKASKVLIKLSPMLDITLALKELNHVKEIHIVSVANECKELLFLLERNWDTPPEFFCVNLNTNQKNERFLWEEEQGCALKLAGKVMRYLYEPNASLLKAGFFKAIAKRYNIYKLHINSHLYTSNVLIPDFPGRIFEVVSWERYDKRVRKTLLHNLSNASIVVRNFPLSVADLRKTLQLSESDEVFLFATTLHESEKVLIRTKKANT